jgi:hypothetical protein
MKITKKQKTIWFQLTALNTGRRIPFIIFDRELGGVSLLWFSELGKRHVSFFPTQKKTEKR